MSVIIPNRRMERGGTAANLASVNEVLLAREWCVETDTGKVKIGDGVTAYNSLEYVGELANLADPGGDRLVFWDNTINQYSFLKLGTGLSIGSGGDLDVSVSGSGQTAIQFQNEGSNVGSVGAIGVVDFVGAGVNSYLDSNGDIVVNVPGGGGGGMTLKGSATVTGAAATSMTISGLDLATDGFWQIRFKIDSAAGSDSYCYLYYNGDTTTTNYDVAIWRILSGGVGGGNLNSGNFFYTLAGKNSSGVADVMLDFDGKARAEIISGAGETTAMSSWICDHRWRTAANVTSITVTHGVASGFAIGSTVEVWA